MRRFSVARTVLRRFLVGCVCVCAGAFWQLPAAWAEIQVGAAVRVITPNPLLPVSGGMVRPNPSREKKGELTARAVVFRKGEVSVAVVALDLLGFPSVLGDRVRAKVTRIPAKNILIASTHTHSAPDCYAFPDGKGGHTGDLNYMNFVCDKAAEAVNEAIDRVQPASIKIATGPAEGKIAYNYYAPDLYDRRMSVIQAIGLNGKTIATLVNYAIHPEVLGNDVGILSPDLVGPLCDQIESQTKGIALFINGAQGGMITADNRNLNQPRDPQRGYWSDSRSWEECLRIGHLMASESLRIIKDAPEQKDPALFCDAITVRFPVDSKLMWAVIAGSPLKYPHNDDHSINARINLINLGNAQILTIPGEALPNIGFYLKRKMHGQNNLLFGLTNEAFGYILTKVDFQSFPRYDYVSRTSLGEMTGEILIEKSLEFVNKSPVPDQSGSRQAQEQLRNPNPPARNTETTKSSPEPQIPAPGVINAQVITKRPPDPLDGPPFVTARTWAIADGKTGEVLWGHDEAKPVDIASTTKIATALVIARLAAKHPERLERDSHVLGAGRSDHRLDFRRACGRAAAGSGAALRAALALRQRRGRGLWRTFRRSSETRERFAQRGRPLASVHRRNERPRR